MRTQFHHQDSPKQLRQCARQAAAFTLAEVTMSILVAGIVFSGILTGYIQAGRRAEWTGYSLAAQAYGIQQLEQARAAVWDISSTPPTNQIVALNLINWTNSGGIWRGYSWTNIDVPYTGTNFIRATNYVTVNTNVQVYPALASITVTSVRVDTVWRYQNKNVTNSMINYYAPDQ